MACTFVLTLDCDEVLRVFGLACTVHHRYRDGGEMMARCGMIVAHNSRKGLYVGKPCNLLGWSHFVAYGRIARAHVFVWEYSCP